MMAARSVVRRIARMLATLVSPRAGRIAAARGDGVAERTGEEIGYDGYRD
jgi:hypothetical protein